MAKKAQLDAVRPALEATDEVLTKVEKVLDKVDKGADVATDAVESGLEKVADVVPDALDAGVHVTTKGTRKLVSFFRNPKHMAVTVVILSTSAGAGLGLLGYKLMKKKLEAKYQAQYQTLLDEKLEEETTNLRRFYAKKNKDGEFATPLQVAEQVMTKDAVDALRSYKGEEGVVVSTEQQTIEEVAQEEAPAVNITALQDRMRSGTPVVIEEDMRSNVFVNGQALVDFDMETEILNRNPDEPYVITHDEFMENENDWSQNTLTYYNGDDILADEREMPIPDIEELIGSENLARFGHGSNDRNVVYVRNEKIQTDFEIVLNQGKFGEIVSGLKHSAPPLRRARWGDDE